jgi:hypothetical protein
MARDPRPPVNAVIPAEHFIATLYAEAPIGSFIELRYRSTAGMRRAFSEVDRLNEVVAMITERSPHTDVFLGVIPRRRRGGGRDDLVSHASVVWVDCDTPDSAAMLRRFSPAPSLIVQTGTAGNLHGYFLLSQPAGLDAIEHANRRLARAIGADAACTDAARILRAVGSTNHKHGRPTPVRAERCDTTARHRLADIIGTLGDVTEWSPRPVRAPRATPADDVLLSAPPTTYVERLTGVVVPWHGKIHCPFHDDRTPSLHVYSEPERGWYCYGCGRGGSIYDFAAQLSGLTTRGADFVQLQRALCDTLGSRPKPVVA